jgi:hypothetical protein
MLKLLLIDGTLHEAFEGAFLAYPSFPDAPYFTDLEEARRWLEENKIQAEVMEA